MRAHAPHRASSRIARWLVAAGLAGCSAEPTRPVPPPIPPVTLAITVRDVLGEPLSGVTIVVDSREDHAEVGLSDSTGRCVVHVPGLHRHLVYARLHGHAGSTAIDLAGADLSQPFPVSVTLRPACVVVGTALLAGRSEHSGIAIASGDLPLSTFTTASGAWAIEGWPATTRTSVLSLAAGFATDVQSFDTGAPGDTLTLPPITLISDPGGTRARRP